MFKINKHFLFLVNKASSDQIKIDHLKLESEQQRKALRARLDQVGL